MNANGMITLNASVMISPKRKRNDKPLKDSEIMNQDWN